MVFFCQTKDGLYTVYLGSTVWTFPGAERPGLDTLSTEQMTTGHTATGTTDRFQTDGTHYHDLQTHHPKVKCTVNIGEYSYSY